MNSLLYYMNSKNKNLLDLTKDHEPIQQVDESTIYLHNLRAENSS